MALVNRTAKIISSEGRQAVPLRLGYLIVSVLVVYKASISWHLCLFPQKNATFTAFLVAEELENNFATNDLSIISIPVLNRKVSYQNLQNL